jgi:hypothetical protein
MTPPSAAPEPAPPTIPQQTKAVAHAVIPLIDDMLRLLTDYGIDVDQPIHGVVTWRDAEIELVFSAIVREVKQHYIHHRSIAARQEDPPDVND